MQHKRQVKVSTSRFSLQTGLLLCVCGRVLLRAKQHCVVGCVGCNDVDMGGCDGVLEMTILLGEWYDVLS